MIKRHHFYLDKYRLVEANDGDWVLYSDVKELEQQLAETKDEIAELKSHWQHNEIDE
jgi:hypothetical protein